MKSDLKKQVLHAAVFVAEGSLTKEFTYEDLLVETWKRNKSAWGLRGYEDEHPDPERLHRELDSRGRGQEGMIGLGWIEKVKPRIFRLTVSGIAEAAAATDDPRQIQYLERGLQSRIRKMIDHRVFQQWLRDPAEPKLFRHAGIFWGVAPGTAPGAVRKRLSEVDHTLEAALDYLNRKGVDEVTDPQGRTLFDREDIKRCREFHETLKERFSAELDLLRKERVR